MSGILGHRNALPAGYRLEHYRLESVLGHGGFGITYRALDEDLQQVVAIKEYLPREVAARDRDATVVPLSEADTETFTWGLERFLDEARTLARFRHPNIVGVRRFLRANGTAYLVMDYCAGESLEGVLAREGTLSAARVGGLLVPLLNALEALHAAGVTHRDVKPGNIFLREDGSPVLLDFGAARQALAQHSRSVTALATPGYAAFEQYSTKGRQGPWTDIYGLGATLYRCVSGQRPPDAGDRMFGEKLVPAVEAGSGRYPRPLLEQIDAALQLRPEYRPQSIDEWRRFGHGSVAVQPRSGVPVASPVEEPRVRAPLPAPEPEATKGGSRSWVGWLLVVGVVTGVFYATKWVDSEKPKPQPSAAANLDLSAQDDSWGSDPSIGATATLDSPARHQAPPRERDRTSRTWDREGEPASGPWDRDWSSVEWASSAPRSPPPQSPDTGSSVPGGLIEGRYEVLGAQGEVVRDTVTGLEWQRCSLGQRWGGRACSGEARAFTWEQARQAADRMPGWRLPAVDELKTLVHCSSGQPDRFSNGLSCEGGFQRPTIVQEAFPNTPSSHFWSGSPYADGSNSAWYVYFSYGYVNGHYLGSSNRVRLVRGGP